MKDEDQEMEITEECYVEGFKEEKSEGKENTKRSVKINEQDMELFELLLVQKFLDLQLIVKRFDPGAYPPKGHPRFYFRLYRLVKEGYLRSIKARGRVLYLLAERGWQKIQDRNKANLPLLLPSEMDTVDHDLACSNVRFYLEGMGASAWASERQFRTHAESVARIPDGAFKLAGRIAFVEVEFSQKSTSRYQEIYKIYSRENGPGRVLYFYRKRTDVNCLVTLAKDNPRFGFFPYSRSLPQAEHLMGENQSSEMSLSQFLAA